MTRPISKVVCFVAAFLAMSAPAASFAQGDAQAFPSRPIRIVCPYPPGVFLDTLGRITAQQLSANLGKPVVVENRAGASGVIGASAVAKAPADGYTLLITVPSVFTIVPHILKEMPFRAEDLTPIMWLSSSPLLFVVHPSVQAKTVKEFVALAKSQPGKINFASGGSGTLPHLAVEVFQAQTGIRLTHVPYKGGAPALNDLLGGHVQVMFDNITSAMPHAKTGRLRPIGTTSGERFPLAPEIPAMREVLPDYEITNWLGMFAPAGTPKEVLQLLHRELSRVLRTPEIRTKFLENGATPVGSTPEAVTATIEREKAQWGPLIRKLGLKWE